MYNEYVCYESQLNIFIKINFEYKEILFEIECRHLN